MRLRSASSVLAAVLLVGAASATTAQPLEYSVKAAFLGKFASYVDWPAQAVAGTAFNMCIVGDDPFGSLLEAAVRGQQVGGRPMTVSHHHRAPRGGCQIIYAGGSVHESVQQTLKAVAGTPVLTVTDERRSAARGILHFALHQNRVRFHVNTKAASDNGLSVSSKLLSLALSVKSSWGAPLVVYQHG
jgi:hypothetical protein